MQSSTITDLGFCLCIGRGDDFTLGRSNSLKEPLILSSSSSVFSVSSTSGFKVIPKNRCLADGQRLAISGPGHSNTIVKT